MLFFLYKEIDGDDDDDNDDLIKNLIRKSKPITWAYYVTTSY